MSVTPTATTNNRNELTQAETVQQIVEGRSKIDEFLLRYSDWLNPILIKETRQALKSRQFSLTFSLLLFAILIWTLGCIALSMPGIYYLPAGPTLLVGYFIMLLVPVGLMVPMNALRSMASEMEEGTYEILSISTLSSRQVVTGKLAVAMLQNMIYFSALTPCIAFTYLMRGVAMSTILFVILVTAVISLVSSTLAILLATLGRNAGYHVLTLVLLLVILLVANGIWMSIAIAMIFQEMNSGLEAWQAWGIFAFVVFIALSYVWLMILASAAQIGFASENHSTRIRGVLLVQFFVYLAVIAGIEMSAFTDMAGQQSTEFWMVFISFAFAHWGIVGTWLVGEQSHISLRALRSLPRSAVGRMWLTWLNPGGGTGYIFAITPFLSLLVFFSLTSSMRWRSQHPLNDWFYMTVAAMTCHLVLYLGLTRLILLVLGRRYVNMLIATVIHVLLHVLAILGTMLISFWLNDFRDISYETICCFHTFWTLIQASEGKLQADALLILCGCSLIVLVANLLTVTRDVMLVRTEAPPRVLQETSAAVPPEIEVNPLA